MQDDELRWSESAETFAPMELSYRSDDNDFLCVTPKGLQPEADIIKF